MLSSAHGDIRPDGRGLGLYDSDTRVLSTLRPAAQRRAAGGAARRSSGRLPERPIQLTNPDLFGDPCGELDASEIVLRRQSLGIVRDRVIAGRLSRTDHDHELHDGARAMPSSRSRSTPTLRTSSSCAVWYAPAAASDWPTRSTKRPGDHVRVPRPGRRRAPHACRLLARAARSRGGRGSFAGGRDASSSTKRSRQASALTITVEVWHDQQQGVLRGAQRSAANADGHSSEPPPRIDADQRCRDAPRMAPELGRDRHRATCLPSALSSAPARTCVCCVNTGHRVGRPLYRRRRAVVQLPLRARLDHHQPSAAVGPAAGRAQHAHACSRGCQATEVDDWRDAQPGKILHELRTGELAPRQRDSAHAVLRHGRRYARCG